MQVSGWELRQFMRQLTQSQAMKTCWKTVLGDPAGARSPHRAIVDSWSDAGLDAGFGDPLSVQGHPAKEGLQTCRPADMRAGR